jgi:hypothetical protein
VSLRKLEGMRPVILVDLSQSKVNLLSPPNSVGIGPTSEFALKSRLAMVVRVANPEGMEPVRRLLLRVTATNRTQLPREEGMEPTRELEPR